MEASSWGEAGLAERSILMDMLASVLSFTTGLHCGASYLEKFFLCACLCVVKAKKKKGKKDWMSHLWVVISDGWFFCENCRWPMYVLVHHFVLHHVEFKLVKAKYSFTYSVLYVLFTNWGWWGLGMCTGECNDSLLVVVMLVLGCCNWIVCNIFSSPHCFSSESVRSQLLIG